MTHGGRVVRRFAAALLTLGLAGTAVPAHAGTSASPHRAVNHFWNLVESGHGAQAVLAFGQTCRTPEVRNGITRLSNQIHSVVRKYGADIYVDRYSERVNGSNARVTYVLMLEVSGVDRQVESIHGQKWVLNGKRWSIDCTP